MLVSNLIFLTFLNIMLFFLGLIGLVLNRKNILIAIMSIELLLLAINLNFITFSSYLNDLYGQVFVLFILTIAATESSVGLALITVFYNLKSTIQVTKINNKKGYSL